MSERRTPNRPMLIAAGAIAAIAAGGLGGLMTDLGAWYGALAKPDWQPADWLFGPVWTLIFALLGAGGVLAWWQSETRTERQTLLIFLFLNLTLNILWSLFFFRLQRPDWAMIEVAFLWSSIVLLMYVYWRRSRLAALLQLPYLAWVSFAAILNAEIVRLNGPLGG